MTIKKRKNSKGDKVYFYFGNGRKAGERTATGVFIYAHPKNQIEKNHNREALILVDTKNSELLLEQQLSKYTGATPGNYFFNVKQVIRAATKDNYWRHNRVDSVQSRMNPSAKLKENLEAEEYIQLHPAPPVGYFACLPVAAAIRCWNNGSRAPELAST